jgi:hypothetical protein
MLENGVKQRRMSEIHLFKRELCIAITTEGRIRAIDTRKSVFFHALASIQEIFMINMMFGMLSKRRTREADEFTRDWRRD